ncbi:GmrSD restriction endonuclease domain-containing protein [Sphingomonas beigongshangi]|uniref:GmrSD restriction endonuclease domain-containing protein n=1 Tax=Sphingomonas beigongshangi TaxID=2782540 RepID=UPI001AEDC722
MTSTQTIESQDITVGGIFQAFYAVPAYQREYVWGTAQVEQLLGDILSEMPDKPTDAPPAEYFIGSIVVCPSHDGVFDLIDGQQRMTTLFVTLCAIRDRLEELGDVIETPISGQLSSQSMDDWGQSRHRYRLDLQYEDAQGVLAKLVGRDRIVSSFQTNSAQNIANAYVTASQFLARELGDDANRVRAFYAYFINRVKLIRIRTEGVTKALKIFETVNDRGLSLDSMDLLKNLLFVRTKQAEFDRLKSVWDELQVELRRSGEKPLRFLRYFIFSRYEVDQLREDGIYDWLKRHEARVGFGAAPIAFARELVDAAKAYTCFLAGQGRDGQARPALQSMRLLGGSAARQHLILLLAARDLPDELFDRLTREIENLFFTYVITREPTRDFERDFARWASEVKAVTSSEGLADLVERRFRPARAALASRFFEAFGRLEAWDLQAYRLRYVLAKLTQAVELDAYGETEGTRWLKRYAEGAAYQIEHIFPVTATAECIDEFGDFSGNWTQRLGNLTLVEQGINSSLGNQPFSRKRQFYGQSQLLLTRAIAEKPSVGVNTRINAAVADLEPFPRWTPEEIETRQMQLATLAAAVWDVPASAPGSSPALPVAEAI